MNKTYLIAAAVGALAGYFLKKNLVKVEPFKTAYAKGVAFAGKA